MLDQNRLHVFPPLEGALYKTKNKGHFGKFASAGVKFERFSGRKLQLHHGHRKMDRIQTYASSDSEEDDKELNQRPRSRKTIQQPKVKIALQKSATTHPSFNTVKDTSILEPASTGYGSFLHVHKPETNNPSSDNIYGITKKEKASVPHHHSFHHVPIHKTDHVQGSQGGDYRQQPPPVDHQYDSRVHDDITFDKRNQRLQGYHQIPSRTPQVPPSQEQPQFNQQCQRLKPNLKRQDQGSQLTPYVPKRLRKSNEDSSVDHQGHGQSSRKENPNFYTTDSVILSHIESSEISSKPPKRLFCNFVLHEGPITHVQWNIPQFSHLLLSSSMDKTVRVWDYSTQRRCVQTLKCHEGAVKDAQWSADGQLILSCGFDKTARLTDVQSGTNFQVFEHSSYVTCIKWHPTDPQMFISGSYGSTMYCWDTRTGSVAHQYAGKLGQILAVEFISNGTEFVATCDTVSRDSTDRTIMVWDTKTAALLSNQLYHEKYTCCSLKAHPTDSVFMAQSNANYIALFSTNRPYRLNKYQRFEGHQVEGYRIGCDFSPDGTLVASGSSDGKMHIYSYGSTKLMKTLGGGQQEGACTDVAWHPVLPGVLASCSWDGKVNIWT